jgi:hypothetical protein
VTRYGVSGLLDGAELPEFRKLSYPLSQRFKDWAKSDPPVMLRGEKLKSVVR